MRLKDLNLGLGGVTNSYRFPAKCHLRSPAQFEAVFKRRSSVTGQHLRVFCLKNGLDHLRIGFIISKKVAKRAHTRNYMKRLIRETVRLSQEDLNGFDLVIRVLKAFEPTQSVQLRMELKRLFADIKKCHGS